ncbi:MAG: methyltransferase domain-containing protein [Planctomycetes bacterium]|nr:methyltransferase domain-containing protein [Planctomycetota bacterium]
MSITGPELEATSPRVVRVEEYVDPEHPASWSRQMIALLRGGHYREAYEILDRNMPFVDNQLRPYAEALAGKENHWTLTHNWVDRFVNNTRSQRILDLGCAVGCHAIEFARKGHSTAGIDILPQMIERGRDLVDELGLADRCRLVAGDVRELERYFGPASFDVAVSCDVFEHLEDEVVLQMLNGVQHVLRPGGRIIVHTSPGRHYYWFEPDRWKLLSLLVPMCWLPDRAFTAYVRWLERWPLRRLCGEHVRFYRHEYGHINCMDPVHLRKLLEQAGLEQTHTFAIHAHPGHKDEGCLKKPWLRRLFGRKSAACRNVFGVATTPLH